MGNTKKLGAAATFGAKYGVSIKRDWLKVHKLQKVQSKCPGCGFPRVKRVNRGVFLCTKCNAQFAGGTYLPQTLTGKIINKMVEQKSFAALGEELTHLREEKPAETSIETRDKSTSPKTGKETKTQTNNYAKEVISKTIKDTKSSENKDVE